MVASALFYGVVCRGGSAKQRDTQKLDKLIKKASSVIGFSAEQDSVVSVADRRAPHKLLSIVDNSSHPLHALVMVLYAQSHKTIQCIMGGSGGR